MSALPQAPSKLQTALPFWMSLGLIPLAFIGVSFGGWTVFLLPLCAWYLVPALDFALGLNMQNGDLDTPEEDFFWYKAVTIAWVPLQFITLFALIYISTRAEHLSGWELVGLFVGVGVLSGNIGINYGHEMMHQKNRLERRLADVLLGMVLYSHFRSEHLLVHHRNVATPGDPATARMGESCYRFYLRVLHQSLRSSWRAEKAMLARRDLPVTDFKNPFWTYGALQISFIVLAFVLGGWLGLGLFLVQAGTAVWQLEVTNYIEHYGLTRKHLGDGKYEHVRPHHSWNAAHKVTNWLLINLQRHSDHHYKPDRRFPILQNYTASDAPQLPYGYPFMIFIASVPPLWRRVMNPRVRKWREMYYPEITQWQAYNKMTNPSPR